MGRAPRTKETLPDFLKWRRVTRPPLVVRGLTGSQRTPGFWGVTRVALVAWTNFVSCPDAFRLPVRRRSRKEMSFPFLFFFSPLVVSFSSHSHALSLHFVFPFLLSFLFFLFFFSFLFFSPFSPPNCAFPPKIFLQISPHLLLSPLLDTWL